MTEVYHDSNHKLVVLNRMKMETFTRWNDWVHIYFMQMQSFDLKKKGKKERLIAYSMLNHGACDHDAHFKYHVVPTKKKKKEDFFFVTTMLCPICSSNT